MAPQTRKARRQAIRELQGRSNQEPGMAALAEVRRYLTERSGEKAVVGAATADDAAANVQAIRELQERSNQEPGMAALAEVHRYLTERSEEKALVVAAAAAFPVRNEETATASTTKVPSKGEKTATKTTKKKRFINRQGKITSDCDEDSSYRSYSSWEAEIDSGEYSASGKLEADLNDLCSDSS